MHVSAHPRQSQAPVSTSRETTLCGALERGHALSSHHLEDGQGSRGLLRPCGHLSAADCVALGESFSPPGPGSCPCWRSGGGSSSHEPSLDRGLPHPSWAGIRDLASALGKPRLGRDGAACTTMEAVGQDQSGQGQFELSPPCLGRDLGLPPVDLMPHPSLRVRSPPPGYGAESRARRPRSTWSGAWILARVTDGVLVIGEHWPCLTLDRSGQACLTQGGLPLQTPSPPQRPLLASVGSSWVQQSPSGTQNTEAARPHPWKYRRQSPGPAHAAGSGRPQFCPCLAPPPHPCAPCLSLRLCPSKKHKGPGLARPDQLCDLGSHLPCLESGSWDVWRPE